MGSENELRLNPLRGNQAMVSKYWESVWSVLSGSVLAQIIPILGSLVIARLFAPAEFGQFSAWQGAVLLLAVMLTGRFETALAVESDGEPRRLAVIGTMATTGVTTCLAGALLGIASIGLPGAFGEIPSTLAVVAIPSAMAFALSQTWQSWAAAEGRYRELSVMRVTSALATTLAQIAAGTLSSSAASLAIAYMFGTMAGLAASSYLMPIGRAPIRLVVSSIQPLWKRHRRFPMFALPADTINAAAAQLPVLLVASRFGADIAGLLALSMRTLGAPLALVGRSVLDVFKRQAAASFRERGECRGEYLNTFKVLALGSAVFCLFLGTISEQLFVIAFGDEWGKAGTIAVWMLPMFAFRFIASPLSYMVYIAGKQHLDLIWQVSLLAMTLISLQGFQGYDVTLQAYSIGYSVLYAIYLVMSYRISLGTQR